MGRMGLIAGVLLLVGCTHSGGTPKVAGIGGINFKQVRHVELNTSTRLRIVQSDNPRVELNGEASTAAAAEILILEEHEGRLRIDTRPVEYAGASIADTNVVLYLSDLESLEVNHRGMVELEGFDNDQLAVHINGDGRVHLSAINTGRMSLNLGGQGRVRISDLKAVKLTGELNGQGQVSATNVDVDRISLRIAGHGSVDLSGAARVQAVRIEGHGLLDANQLASSESSLSIEGHGAARVWSSTRLSLDVQHHGSVQYRGEPVVLSARPQSNVREVIGGV